MLKLIETLFPRTTAVKPETDLVQEPQKIDTDLKIALSTAEYMLDQIKNQLFRKTLLGWRPKMDIQAFSLDTLQEYLNSLLALDPHDPSIDMTMITVKVKNGIADSICEPNLVINTNDGGKCAIAATYKSVVPADGSARLYSVEIGIWTTFVEECKLG